MDKLHDLMQGAGMHPHRLTGQEIQGYVPRVLAMDFASSNIVLDNLLAGDSELGMGERAVRSISLINTDTIDLPETVGTYAQRQDSRKPTGIFRTVDPSSCTTYPNTGVSSITSSSRYPASR